MQEPAEMDIAPLSPTSAAEAVRAGGSAQAQRRPATAGFGAALDRALRPEPVRRENEARELERRRLAERDDDEERIAAAQQSAWQAAREARAAARPQPHRTAERMERLAEERRVNGTEAREARAHGERPAPPAAAAAVAMARRIEAARESAAAAERSTERAAASAAEAAARTADADAAAHTVSDVERSLEALAPEFRGRLERVIARMEAEGHDVAVTETHRDAERQNQLYEQGRTRPGPVVTWTRNSNHMHGRAADLVVDGSYDNPAGYARLARIAAEEGLQTLGARDAGHVEMRGAAPLVRTPASAAATQQIQPELIGPMYVQGRSLGVAQVAAVAEVAGVAPVSGVAQVAQVAAVAQVAQPGSYAPVAQPVNAPAIARPLPAEGVRTSATEASPATGSIAAASATGSGLAVASLAGSSAQDGDLAGDASPDGQPPSHGAADKGATQTAAPFAFDVARTAALRSEGAEAVQRADVAGRLDRVQALQDAASAQPLSQVTLRVEGEDGTSSRINVGLRGNTVGATIDAADPLAAASMRAHVAELRQALERQGLDPSSLLVRTAARLDGGEAGKLAAVLTGADALATLASSAGRESAQRDSGGSQNQQHTATRRDPDAQRQRQNRNGKEDRP